MMRRGGSEERWLKGEKRDGGGGSGKSECEVERMGGAQVCWQRVAIKVLARTCECLGERFHARRMDDVFFTACKWIYMHSEMI